LGWHWTSYLPAQSLKYWDYRHHPIEPTITEFLIPQFNFFIIEDPKVVTVSILADPDFVDYTYCTN
jgi:hypothetical protein